MSVLYFSCASSPASTRYSFECFTISSSPGTRPLTDSPSPTTPIPSRNICGGAPVECTRISFAPSVTVSGDRESSVPRHRARLYLTASERKADSVSSLCQQLLRVRKTHVFSSPRTAATRIRLQAHAPPMIQDFFSEPPRESLETCGSISARLRAFPHQTARYPRITSHDTEYAR